MYYHDCGWLPFGLDASKNEYESPYDTTRVIIQSCAKDPNHELCKNVHERFPGELTFRGLNAYSSCGILPIFTKTLAVKPVEEAVNDYVEFCRVTPQSKMCNHGLKAVADL